jgi:hypothetical protein
MKKYRMIILTALLAVFLAIGGGFSFAQATMLEIAGKVEVKAPNAGWGPAWVGMTIAQGSMIGTGFNSKAVIQLDASTLYVKQLTRLTLEEIARQQGVVKTNVFIRAGSLEADVKTGEGYTHDFKVRSPVATAAVRGTKIKYHGSKLFVRDGKAMLFNLLGQPTMVFNGNTGGTTDGLDLLTSRDLDNLLSGVPLTINHFGPLFTRPSTSPPGETHNVTFSFDWSVFF